MEVTTSNGQKIDTEKEKENLEQVDKEVDEINNLKQEIQDKVDNLVEEEKELKTEYAKDTKYYKIFMGKETEYNQGKLIDMLQTLKTDIRNGVQVRNDYTIDDVDDLLYKVNQGQSIKLFDAWYLNEEDYTGKKVESFPTTEYTNKKLSLEEVKQRPLKECLTDDQQAYIIMYVCDLDDFVNGFEDMYTEVPVEEDEQLLSVDEYIDYLLGGNK
jgi:hypothetical protein